MFNINRWMSSIALFRSQLLVLMHLCGGQRARAPEILSIRHRNTSGGDYRDVFVDQGLIVFVIQYHKGDYYQWPRQDHSSVSTAGGGCSGDVLSMAGFAVSRAARSYIAAAGHGIITNVARRL